LGFVFGAKSGRREDMEFQMRSQISYTALALALLAGTTAANAQTVFTRDLTDQPLDVIAARPMQTVQTTETIETVRSAHPTRTARRRVITTRRTIVSERIFPTTPVAPAVAAYPPPLYDVVAPPPAPLFTPPAYPAPLYDEAVAAPLVGPTPVAAVIAPPYVQVPTYRYVYEPDRILVIDPATNIAIQAIPR